MYKYLERCIEQMNRNNLDVVKSCIREGIDISSYMNYEDLGLIKALLKYKIDPKDIKEEHLAETLYYMMITGDRNINSIRRRCTSTKYNNIYTKGELRVMSVGIPLHKFKDSNLAEDMLFTIANVYELYNIDLTEHLYRDLKHLDVAKLNAIAYADMNNIDISKYIYAYDGNQISVLTNAIQNDLDISKIDKLHYDYRKMLILLQLQVAGIDIIKYNKDDYTAEVIKELYEASIRGIDLFKYAERGYDLKYLKCVRKHITGGTKMNKQYMKYINQGYSLAVVDLIIDSITELKNEEPSLTDFINPQMNYSQVNEIYKGLKQGIKVQKFKAINYDEKIMLMYNRLGDDKSINIRKLLKEYKTNKAIFNHLAELYFKKKTDLYDYSYDQIYQLLRAYIMNIDINTFNKDFTPQQINILSDIKAAGYDISKIANPCINSDLLWLIAKYENKGIDLTPYLAEDITKEQLIEIAEELERIE